LRILHLINYYQPKIGYQEFFLAKKQKELGHEVFFITSDRYFPFQNYKNSYEPLLGPRKIKSGKFIENGIIVYRLKPLFEINISFIKSPFIVIKGVAPIIEELKPDLIICHGTTIPLSVQLSKINFSQNKPFIIYDDHQGYPSKYKLLLHKIYGKIFSFFYLNDILKTKDKIIAVSHHTRDFLIDIFGFSNKDIEVAPVGVDTGAFYFSINSRIQIRKKLNLSENDIVCIYTGKISNYKGIPELLQAYQNLKMKYDNFYLILIGFIQDQNIKKVIDTIDSVIYLESVENKKLYKYFSASDFAIWPDHVTISHYEAMACKLPIIVSGLDVSKERIKWGNGFSLNTLSNKEIYDKCELLIADGNKRKKMGRKSFEAVNKELSWDSIVKQFLI
jgi:glycosyltransferase involved in cell wall biosynthesis